MFFITYVEVLAGLVVGFIAKKIQVKFVFLVLQLIGMCGTLLYMLAGYPIGSAWVIVAARFLSGVSAGKRSFPIPCK
jgi:uncharacterized membrane protein